MKKMRLKRFSGRVRRVEQGEAPIKELLALEREDPRTPTFREHLLGLIQKSRRYWEALSPEDRQRLLFLLSELVALLPAGRLGRVGWLLKRAAGPKGQAILSLLLRLLKR